MVYDLQVAVRWPPLQLGTEYLEIYSSFISTEFVLQVFKKEKCVTSVSTPQWSHMMCTEAKFCGLYSLALERGDLYILPVLPFLYLYNSQS